MEQIKQKVKDYILEVSFAENEKINNETMIFQEGYLDSMGFVMLLGFIEESFGIKPNDDDLIEENFESIIAISDFIAKKQAA